jgi:hypothetical protein
MIKFFNDKRKRHKRIKQQRKSISQIADKYKEISYDMCDIHSRLFSSSYDHNKTWNFSFHISELQAFADSIKFYPHQLYDIGHYRTMIKVNNAIQGYRDNLKIYIEDGLITDEMIEKLNDLDRRIIYEIQLMHTQNHEDDNN